MTAWNSYKLLLTWQALRLRSLVVVIAITNVLTSMATILGLSLFSPYIDPRAAQYLVTGAPTFALINLGLINLAQQLSAARQAGTDEYRCHCRPLDRCSSSLISASSSCFSFPASSRHSGSPRGTSTSRYNRACW